MYNSEWKRGYTSLNRFISEVVLFALLLSAGAFTLDGFLTENLKRARDGDLGIWNEIFDGKIGSEIVVYGASRALVHFDPRIIERGVGMTVYNLGIDGHNFWLEYLRHSMLLKYNVKPKVIVLEVGSATLAKRRDLYTPEQFLPYMLSEPEVANAISSYDGYKYLDFHVPLLRYFGKAESVARALIHFLIPYYMDSDRIKGYQGRDIVWSSGDWERAKLASRPLEVTIDPQTVKLLESFLEECRVMDIKVVFVASPEFIEGQGYVTNRKEIFEIFEAMSIKFRIPLLDYSHDSISYKTEFFYNSSHLNVKGAELFTRKFVTDLKPLLERQH